MSTTSNFVELSLDGRDFVVQANYSVGRADVGVVFTSGTQSWVLSVRPAHRSKGCSLADANFLDKVVQALVSLDSDEYELKLTFEGEHLPLHLDIKYRMKQEAGPPIAVNLCKLELAVSDDPARTVRAMLKTLISQFSISRLEQAKQEHALASLKDQLKAANHVAAKAVESMKDQEATLLTQFVAVLNTKKDEIARCRREVSALTEKLAAERQRAAALAAVDHAPTGIALPASGVTAGAGHGITNVPNPVTKKREIDSESETDLGSSSDEDVPPARVPLVESLPLASMDRVYVPPVRKVNRRGIPVGNSSAAGVGAGSSVGAGAGVGAGVGTGAGAGAGADALVALPRAETPIPVSFGSAAGGAASRGSFTPAVFSGGAASVTDLIDEALDEGQATRQPALQRRGVYNRIHKRAASDAGTDMPTQATVTSVQTTSNDKKRQTQSEHSYD